MGATQKAAINAGLVRGVGCARVLYTMAISLFLRGACLLLKLPVTKINSNQDQHNPEGLGVCYWPRLCKNARLELKFARPCEISDISTGQRARFCVKTPFPVLFTHQPHLKHFYTASAESGRSSLCQKTAWDNLAS
jgi:hypothetical protein